MLNFHTLKLGLILMVWYI